MAVPIDMSEVLSRNLVRDTLGKRGASVDTLLKEPPRVDALAPRLTQNVLRPKGPAKEAVMVKTFAGELPYLRVQPTQIFLWLANDYTDNVDIFSNIHWEINN